MFASYFLFQSKAANEHFRLLSMVQGALLTSAFCQCCLFQWRTLGQSSGALSCHLVILEAHCPFGRPQACSNEQERTDFVGDTLYWKHSSVGSLAPSGLVSFSVLEVNYFSVPVFMFPGSRPGERIQQGKDNCVIAALCTQSQDCLLQAVNIITIIKQSAHRNSFLLQIFPSNQY